MKLVEKKNMKKSNLKKFWFGLAGGILVVGLIFVWVFVVGIKAGRDGSFYNNGRNAVWVAHEWAQEVKTDLEIQNLVAGLDSHDIDTIFLHVGPLGEDGSIDPSVYAESVRFVEKVRRSGVDMKVLAWMGQIRSRINLGDPAVRHNIINMCLIFTEMVGMDGVHYDIEPVWDEDDDFIKLLAETAEFFDGFEDGDEAGAGVGPRKILSVALAEFIPSSFVWWLENITEFENYNTEKNYLNVARHADQIVDMVYDTGIDRGWLYEWLVKEQVIWVSDLMGREEASGTEFLIGIPAYEDDKDGFNPEIENIRAALLGVVSGLNDIRSSEENFTGVAIYAEWEMDYEEWMVYDYLWSKSGLK